MALSTVVALLGRDGAALIETRARQWDANAVRRELENAHWTDVSQDPGFSDYLTELDATTALRLHEYFRAGYLSWIALLEDLAGSYRSKGEFQFAHDDERVGEEHKAELAALTEIVRRAGAEGLKVRVLLEEWTSGY